MRIIGITEQHKQKSKMRKDVELTVTIIITQEFSKRLEVHCCCSILNDSSKNSVEREKKPLFRNKKWGPPAARRVQLYFNHNLTKYIAR